MNNISYAINGVLGVAIIVLFILFFTSKNGSSSDIKTVKFEAGDSTATLPIAYVNVDSLLVKYQFAKDASAKLMSKYNASNNAVAQKQRAFEAEATEFQRKLQQNAFISEDRARQEGQRIQKIEADLQQMAQRLQTEFAQEQQRMNEQITDSVRANLKLYNKTANYDIIFSDRAMDNVLIAKDKYDITDEILVLLNSRYKPTESSKK